MEKVIEISKVNLTIGSLNVFMEDDKKSSKFIAAEAMFKMKELHKINFVCPLI